MQIRTQSQTKYLKELRTSLNADRKTNFTKCKPELRTSLNAQHTSEPH